MNKKHILIYGIGGFVIVMLMVFILIQNNLSTDTEILLHSKENDTQYDSTIACSVDSDCVLIPEGPCGCRGGGKNIVVNKKRSLELETERNQNRGSRQIMCPAVLSNDPSCFGVPKCIKKKCTLVSDVLKENR